MAILFTTVIFSKPVCPKCRSSESVWDTGNNWQCGNCGSWLGES